MLFSFQASSLQQYLPIFVFFAIAMLLSIIIMILPQLLAPRVENKEKLTSYECGFEAINDIGGRFNIKFYLIAMLFIIFDLEIAFLMPWAITLKQIGSFGYFSMMIFLFILGVGFLYEYKKGALEW